MKSVDHTNSDVPWIGRYTHMYTVLLCPNSQQIRPCLRRNVFAFDLVITQVLEDPVHAQQLQIGFTGQITLYPDFCLKKKLEKFSRELCG
jgi:hypothetical protein